MLDPTWMATNNPHAAPAIASPMRSRTWAAFRTRDCIVLTTEREDIKLGHYSAMRKSRRHSHTPHRFNYCCAASVADDVERSFVLILAIGAIGTYGVTGP